VRNILVTGGAGFIGANFIHYCLENFTDDKIVNLDLLTYAGNLENLSSIEDHKNYQFIHGSICDRGLLEQIFEQEQIDTVINFAAESHVDRSISGPETFIKANVFGAFTLLDVARHVWDDKEKFRFIHVSTDEVYGTLEVDDTPFTEQSSYAPNSPYSASKAASDHLVRAYLHTYGLPVITTNCSNNYGPYQFPEKLIPLMFINAIENKPLPVYGDGGNIRDWLYVKDHCSAIARVLSSGSVGETYNIGGGNEWKNIDIVNLICEYIDSFSGTSRSKKELITFVTDRPGHDFRYAIDASKIYHELGWRPAHQFEQGIIETIDWYRNNMRWLNRVRDQSYQEYYRSQYQGIRSV
jgi:dTDP-glucose 4,6-dehydratase